MKPRDGTLADLFCNTGTVFRVHNNHKTHPVTIMFLLWLTCQTQKVFVACSLNATVQRILIGIFSP